MKILVVGHSLGHYRQRAMWEWIAKEGHKVYTMIMPRYREEVYEDFTDGSFTQITTPQYASPIGDFWHFPAIYDYILKIDPDVVFCYQEPWSLAAYTTMQAAKLMKKPFGLFTWENIPKIYPNPYRKIQSEVVKGADLIVAGNKDAARIMVHAGGDFVVHQLQTGLDPEVLVPINKLKIESNPEPTKLLFLGRFVKEKGIETILQAYDKLEGDFQLRFVGGRGEMGDLITSHPEYGKTIFVEDWITDYMKLPKIYNWADLSLMPSIDTQNWIEQCGYVVGESLLCHLPVITSYSKSIVEWWSLPDVKFIPQGDADALADLLMDKKTYAPAIKGRNAVIEKYSNAVIGQSYIEMLEEII